CASMNHRGRYSGLTISPARSHLSMSMICELLAVPESSAQDLIDAPQRIHELLQAEGRSDQVLGLEKSWHGLHFALTGSAWEGEEPLNFLLCGTPVGEDLGYGPARVLLADEVARVDAALNGVSDAQFAQQFDVAAMQSEDVYPSIWDEPLEDLLEEYG